MAEAFLHLHRSSTPRTPYWPRIPAFTPITSIKEFDFVLLLCFSSLDQATQTWQTHKRKCKAAFKETRNSLLWVQGCTDWFWSSGSSSSSSNNGSRPVISILMIQRAIAEAGEQACCKEFEVLTIGTPEAKKKRRRRREIVRSSAAASCTSSATKRRERKPRAQIINT